MFRGAPWECSRKVRCINSVIVGRLSVDRDLDNRYDEKGASVTRVTASIVPLIYGPTLRYMGLINIFPSNHESEFFGPNYGNF